MSEGDAPRERLRKLRDEIKRAIDYRAFYQRYLSEARQTGARLHALCPIPSHAHSGKGHPSLSIDLQQGLFNCFSRGEGGDCITFYELMHGVTFSRAVREMARELGIRTGRQPSLVLRSAPDVESLEGQAAEPVEPERMRAVCETFLEVCRGEDQLEAVRYLARRGIDWETAKRAGVAYFPRRAYRRVMRRMLDAFPLGELQGVGLFNQRSHLTFYRHRLLFPFFVERRAVYLQARAIAAGVEPRWHNMRGRVSSLYNVDSLENLPGGTIVYLVEGFTDTLTLMANGFNAAGLVGAGGLKEEWLAPLSRFQVVTALDPDAAGRRAAARYEEMFAGRGMRLVNIELPTDVNDFFRRRASASLEFTLMTEAAIEASKEE